MSRGIFFWGGASFSKGKREEMNGDKKGWEGEEEKKGRGRRGREGE